MPFRSTTIFTLAYLLPLSLAHLPQQKHRLNLLFSITNALLTHTLASFWRKQSCHCCHGPLTIYVRLRVAHGPGMVVTHFFVSGERLMELPYTRFTFLISAICRADSVFVIGCPWNVWKIGVVDNSIESLVWWIIASLNWGYLSTYRNIPDVEIGSV